MSKSTPTLTQSGLLAVLLQRQRYVSHLARCRAHRKHLHTTVWSGLTSAWQAFRAPKLLDDSGLPTVRVSRRHTFLRVAPSGTAVHAQAKRV
jgi:hypothetical protein